jgi:CheY-like chemotaxis protein
MTFPTDTVVFVVDDYPDAAESLADMLAAHGVRARFALTAADALSFVPTPSVVMMEPRLRNGDGYAVMEAFVRRGAEVIALTSGGRQEDFDRTAALGARVHLLKPATARDVLDALHAAVGSPA